MRLEVAGWLTKQYQRSCEQQKFAGRNVVNSFIQPCALLCFLDYELDIFWKKMVVPPMSCFAVIGAPEFNQQNPEGGRMPILNGQSSESMP
jgi:hypothetical protein